MRVARPTLAPARRNLESEFPCCRVIQVFVLESRGIELHTKKAEQLRAPVVDRELRGGQGEALGCA